MENKFKLSKQPLWHFYYIFPCWHYLKTFSNPYNSNVHSIWKKAGFHLNFHELQAYLVYIPYFDLRQGFYMFALKMSQVSQSSNTPIICIRHSSSCRLYGIIHALVLWLKMTNSGLRIQRKRARKLCLFLKY